MSYVLKGNAAFRAGKMKLSGHTEVALQSPFTAL